MAISPPTLEKPPTSSSDWSALELWRPRDGQFIRSCWSLFCSEIKMTTQIQQEYIKTVNCQKTSLDVLGTDPRDNKEDASYNVYNKYDGLSLVLSSI